MKSITAPLYIFLSLLSIEVVAQKPEIMEPYIWLKSSSLEEKMTLSQIRSKEMSDFQLNTFRDTVNYHLMRGMVYEKDGRRDRKHFLLDSLSRIPASFKSPSFCYIFGNKSFLAGDYQLAALSYMNIFNEGMVLGMSEADSVTFSKTIYMNMGSAFNRLENYGKAMEYYLKAVDPKVSNTLLVNNIASLHINNSDYERAYQLLKQIDLQSAIQTETISAVHLNLLTACIGTDRMKEAEQLARMINFKTYNFADTAGTLSAALRYQYKLRDTFEFLSIVKNNESFMRRSKRDLLSGAYLIYKAHKLGNSAMIADAWSLLEEMLPSDSKPRVEPLIPFSLLNTQSKINMLTLFLLSIATVGFLAYRRGRSVQRKILLTVEDDIKATVSETLREYGLSREVSFQDDNHPADQVVNGRGDTPLSDPGPAAQAHRDLELRIQFFMDELNLTEARMLQFLLKGMITKEIANELQCSVGYAYNLRSTVRRKFEEYFNREEDPDFDKWLKSKLIETDSK